MRNARAGGRVNRMGHVWKPSELSRVRTSYDRGALAEDDMKPTPLAQFEAWLREAAVAGAAEPNAMALATVDGDRRGWSC